MMITDKPSHCAPTRYSWYLNSGTCFSPDELLTVAKKYNGAVASNQRVPSRLMTIEHAASGALHDALALRIGTRDDAQWLKKPWLASTMQLKAAFRPEMPRAWLANSRAWLSTEDIERVMTQYQYAYPKFKFLGVFPIDFDTRTLFGGCIADEMCNLSVAKLHNTERKTQFGAVLNLDKHDQRGSHWVAVYGNSDTTSPNFGVHYFDSVGKKAPSEVERFQARIAAQIAAMSGKKITQVPITNRVEKRQYKNTECGVFAMYFLICCMSDKMKIPDVVQAMGHDDLIHKLRYIFFRPPS